MFKRLLQPKYFLWAIAVWFSSVMYAQSNDWVSLFDGKTLNGWKKVAGPAHYEIADGVLVGTVVNSNANTFLISDKEYSNFILEMEVRMDDTVANSGVQFRSHYDAQGFDGKGKVFGYQCDFDPTARKWFGGIYDEARRGWLYPLTLNKEAGNAFKVGAYNKIRIECLGNTIQVFVNGIQTACLIDAVDAKGIIGLQVHGTWGNTAMLDKKVYWKNIRIKTKDVQLTPTQKNVFVVNTIPNYLSEPEKANGWQLLFDGATTNGWVGAYKETFPEKGWEIANGELTVLASDGGESTNGGDIVTKEKYAAFDLQFDFKLTEGANSGVKYFVTLSEGNTGSAIGLEYQLLDDNLHPDAKQGKEGNRTLASLYDLIKAEKQTRFFKQPGEWNTGRIVVHSNNHVEHYLNGIKVLEYTRGSDAYRKIVAESKYKDWLYFGEAQQGHILLQDHGNEVSFRSIKIKSLN